jgi:hydrogenase maturation protease
VKRLLVIMTDDGIGARVAGALQSRLEAHGIGVLIGETDVPCCLDAIRPDDYLIVIDSMLQGKAPGSLEIIPLQDARKSRGRLHSQHDFSLIDALSSSFPDIQGCLIGIEAAVLGFGFELSGELQTKFGQICEDVFQAILKMKEASGRARYAPA